jgi:hypothetical protein
LKLWLTLALTAGLTACSPATPMRPQREVASTLAPLPCSGRGPLRPVSIGYCLTRRHYVTPVARTVLLAVANGVARDHPGAVVLFMDASWPKGTRPMPPHFSHGDGREVDLALFFATPTGKPLTAPPTLNGYGAFEPPSHEAGRVCVGVAGPHHEPDPSASRSWRLDEARTSDLVRRLIADPHVRRVFIEPHLKTRLGLAREDKVRFAGCKAARHDDHIHVDFS